MSDLGSQLLAQAGLGSGTSYDPGSASGKGGNTDWSKVAALLGNAGSKVGQATGDASYDKRGGEGPGGGQGATQGLPNLLATLMQMHRQSMLSQATPAPLQPRVSLLG